MNTPEGLKPGLYGAAIGAAALAIAGFSWGGWMTESAAKKMAAEQSRLEVVAALVPICIEQSERDPLVEETLAGLKDAQSYQRNNMLIDTGWATMPGSAEANRDVANACMKALASRF